MKGKNTERDAKLEQEETVTGKGVQKISETRKAKFGIAKACGCRGTANVCLHMVLS